MLASFVGSTFLYTLMLLVGLRGVAAVVLSDDSGLNARSGFTGLFCNPRSVLTFGVAEIGRAPLTFVLNRSALRSLRDSGPIVCCRLKLFDVSSGEGGSGCRIVAVSSFSSSFDVMNEVSFSPSPLVVVVSESFAVADDFGVSVGDVELLVAGSADAVELAMLVILAGFDRLSLLDTLFERSR